MPIFQQLALAMSILSYLQKYKFITAVVLISWDECFGYFLHSQGHQGLPIGLNYIVTWFVDWQDLYETKR